MTKFVERLRLLYTMCSSRSTFWHKRGPLSLQTYSYCLISQLWNSAGPCNSFEISVNISGKRKKSIEYRKASHLLRKSHCQNVRQFLHKCVPNPVPNQLKEQDLLSILPTVRIVLPSFLSARRVINTPARESAKSVLYSCSGAEMCAQATDRPRSSLSTFGSF